jgi:hypothetical protein
MRSLKGLRQLSSWFLLRLVCFLLLMVIAQRAPGWIKGPLWLAVFFIGVWAFLALMREARTALDYLIPRLEYAWQWIAKRNGRSQRAWKIAGLLCAAAIVAITVYRAWPIWHFKATSSLRDDEIMSIVRYTSRGFVPAISTYSLARNHILYNVISSFFPGADSTLPLRARLISFVSVIASLGLLIAYTARRGWLLPGVACAGLVAVNFFAMDRVLEARGYGLIFLLAMLSCVAFAEWLRTRRKVWLNLMAISCVLGTYTLPFYVVFAGGLLLVAFLYRPSREAFLAGFLSLAAILMLYLPVAGKVYAVFTGYRERYRDTFISAFDSIDGVFSAFESFLPVQIEALALVLIALVALLYVAFGRFAARFDRFTLAGVAAAILGFLAFCLYCKTVPARVVSYIAAPLAFLTAIMTGSLLSIRALTPIRPFVDVLEPQVFGRQPYDPGLLSQSVGHGDVLRPKEGENTNPAARIAQPAEISLPALMTVELDSKASAGTCNLLFSQGLHDKLISAEVKNVSGDWRATSNILVRGELLSVALDPNGCTAVRIHVQNHPSFSTRTSGAARPPFGLIDAWLAAGKTRLP